MALSDFDQTEDGKALKRTRDNLELNSFGDLSECKPNKDKMDGFLVGLVVGEGSFHITIGKAPNNKKKWYVGSNFGIKLHKSDGEILEYLHNSIELGNIRYNGKYVEWRISDLSECVKFSNTFDKMIRGTAFIHTEKYNSYVKWKECLLMILENKGETKEGLIEIAEKRDEINRDSRGRTKDEVIDEVI